MTNLGMPVSVKVQKVAEIGALFSMSSLFDNADATHQWPDSYASWPNLTCGRNTGCLYFSVRRLSYELRSNRHQSSPAHVITDDSKRTTPARRKESVGKNNLPVSSKFEC
jgi:hypothetical protein